MKHLTIAASILTFLLTAGTAHADTGITRAKEKLRVTRITMEFNETPMEDVVSFLRSVSNLNILIDPEVLRERREELNVTLAVKDISLENALSLLTKFHGLSRTYRKGGIILLTTREKARGQLSTKVYDIRDLTFIVRDFRGPDIRLKENGTGIAPFDMEDDQEPNRVTDSEQLVELIESNVPGGDEDGVKVSVLGGRLVVSHTAAGHKAIVRLLNLMRTAR